MRDVYPAFRETESQVSLLGWLFLTSLIQNNHEPRRHIWGWAALGPRRLWHISQVGPAAFSRQHDICSSFSVCGRDILNMKKVRIQCLSRK